MTREAPSSDPQRVLDAYFHDEVDFWEDIYKGDGVLEQIHQQRLRVILDLVDRAAEPPGKRALDVGCGAGLATVALAKRGWEVCAVDAVLDMVKMARTRVARERLQSRVNCARGDINHLPFPDETFKLIIAIGVLPWLASIAAATREMCRVLEPGGRLIVTTDNRWGLCWFFDPLTNPLLRPAKKLALNLAGRFRNGTPRVQMTSIRQCRGLLRAVGLRLLDDTTLGFGPFSFFRRDLLPSAAGLALNRRLQALADRRIPLFRQTGAQYVAVAEKSSKD